MTPARPYLKPYLATLALALGALLAGCQPERQTATSPEPVVSADNLVMDTNSAQLAAFVTAPAEMAPGSLIHLNGRLVWDDDVTVRVFSPFAGRVRGILANPGQRAAKGMPLAEIESPDFGQAQADARRAQSDWQLAQKNLSRIQDLFEHGAAARKDLESAEADQARALAERDRTQARLTTYRSNCEVINQMFILPSPLDGWLVEKNINPGQEVRPDQILANAPQFCLPLFVITDPARLWVLVDATEQDLPDLKPGQEIVIHARAYPNREFKGAIDVVADALDAATHKVRVRASVRNPERLLKGEMFVTVDLPVTRAAGIQVPVKAVFLKGEKQFVFIEQARGQFQRREIKADPAHEGKVRVLEGVRPGERVVTENALLLEQMMHETGQGI